MPAVGISIERRNVDRTSAVYSDKEIMLLICIVCACIRVITPNKRSQIHYYTFEELLQMPKGSVLRTFSTANYNTQYRKDGPFICLWRRRGASTRLHRLDITHTSRSPSRARGWPRSRTSEYDALELCASTLLCCPEDHRCNQGCVQHDYLCRQCEIPMCSCCSKKLRQNQLPIMALVNDSLIDYLEEWIYKSGFTWMEHTCTSLYWTSMLLFCIDMRPGSGNVRRKHLLSNKGFENDGRIVYRGHLFSAPMDWPHMVEQLQEMERKETLISLPARAVVLASRVQLARTSGLTDLHKIIKQATARRNIIVQLIRMRIMAKHPDYINLNF